MSKTSEALCYVSGAVRVNAAGSDSVAVASESDAEAVECHASPPSSLPVIRQSGASSAIDDVTAYVDAAGMATTPVVHGDVVVDVSQDGIQVAVNVTCCVVN